MIVYEKGVMPTYGTHVTELISIPSSSSTRLGFPFLFLLLCPSIGILYTTYWKHFWMIVIVLTAVCQAWHLAEMTSSMEMEMSKTYQYRKVMKPMLERKRRARINKCLDELKDLMVATLESEGEHVTRLEKADILELTVSHLMKLKQQKRLNGNTALSKNEAFRSGYIYAANEVSRTLSRIPGVNISLGTQLMTHLGQRLNQIQQRTTSIKVPVPVTHPLTVQCGYSNTSPPYSVSLSPISSFSGSPRIDNVKNTDLSRCNSEVEENVWRPW